MKQYYLENLQSIYLAGFDGQIGLKLSKTGRFYDMNHYKDLEIGKKVVKMKRNTTNIADWIQHWNNFDYGLYLAILKAKQR